MWDAQIISRVMDRKQNEAVVFSALMKNAADADRKCILLSKLVEDIRFCFEIINKGSSDIRTAPITCTDYTDRLSDSERSDEEYFDSIRMAPVDSAVLENIISDLEERNNHLQESLDTVMYELKVTKERNEELSLDLDYANAEAKAEDTDYFGTEEEAASAETPAADEECPVEEPVAEVPAVEEIKEEVSEDKPIVDEVKTMDQIVDNPMKLTEIDIMVAKKVKAMKESKIDYFIDLSMSGRNVKACEDIISFLKVDYRLCEIVENTDINDDEAIIKSFNDMLDLLEYDYKSPFQKFYVKCLTPQDKVHETMFNGLMEKIQRIMLTKLPIVA